MPRAAHPAPASRDPVVAADVAGRASVWTLTFAPGVWALHFLACYVAAAVWCAKAGRAAELGSIRSWIVVFTLLALAALAAFGWRGLRHWCAASAGSGGAVAGTVSEAARLQQQRFMGGLTALLCALSMVAVAYAALVVALIGTCG